jgi:rubredoxin
MQQENTLRPHIVFQDLTTAWHCTRCGTTFRPEKPESRKGFSRDEQPPENVRQLFQKHVCQRQRRERRA